MDRGTIRLLNASYGFIKADQSDDIFFHITDVQSDQPIKVGCEVEFTVGIDPKKNNLRASNITVISQPKSASQVTHQTAVNTVLAGTVERELVSEKRRSNNLFGQIRANDGNMYEFGDRDLLRGSAVPLRVGDQVEFVVGSDRRSGKQIANRVRITECSGTGHEHRERGIIHLLKGDGGVTNYGFIRVANGGGELFFHRSSFIDASHNIAVGDEVEFDVSGTEDGRYSAQRIVILPKGTVIDEASMKFTATVETEFAPLDNQSTNQSATQSDRERNQVRHGVLSCQVQGQKQSVPFSSNDCSDSRLVLLKGDTVTCNLAHNPDKSVRAMNITLLHESDTYRELGIVVSLNSGGTYAFVRRVVQPDPDLFLHFTQYQPEDSSSSRSSHVPLSEGQELEFSVYKGEGGRLSAVRARPVPKGTVKLSRTLPVHVICSLLRLPKKSHSKGRQSASEKQATMRDNGEVKVLEIVPDESSTDLTTSLNVPFQMNDTLAFSDSFVQHINQSNTLMLIGDRVQCTVSVHAWSNVASIESMSVIETSREKREKGIVESVDPVKHCIHIAQPTRANSLITAFLKIDKSRSPPPDVVNEQQQVAEQVASMDLQSSDELPEKPASTIDLGWSVGDCVEFNVVAARNAAGWLRSINQVVQKNDDNKIAVRLVKLAPGSVTMASVSAHAVHRSLAPVGPTNRGRIESLPGNPQRSQSAQSGTMTILSSTVADVPGQVKFSFREITNGSFLARGDLVSFAFGVDNSVRSITFLPRQGTVTSMTPNGGGVLTLMSMSSASQDEQCLFSVADFVGPAPSPIQVGDVLEMADVMFEGSKKKRVAKQLTRIKAAPATRSSTRSAAAPAQSTSRFARGPPNAEEKGFQRRQPGFKENQGVAISLTKSTSANAIPPPQSSPSPTHQQQ